MSIEIDYDQPSFRSISAAKKIGWPQLLSPSLSDLFFVFVTAWMFIVSSSGWSRLLLDADTALHLRIGQYILATGVVPHQDLFSFSKPGQPWYAFEWLSETAFAGVFQAAGLKGVALLAGVLISLYVTLLLKYALWKRANGLIALVLILLTTTGTTIHFHARPHLFTLLLLTLAVWLLEYNRRHGGVVVWALVPITALWANLHGGFFIFFALLGLRAMGCSAEAYFWPNDRAQRRREATQLAWLGAACVAASLLNPYGYKLHEHVYETLRSSWIIINVSEFQSPSFRTEEMYDTMMIMFAGLASITPLVRKKNLVEPLWILFLAYCSVTSVRHTTIFLLIATPIIASELSEWWDSVAAAQPRALLIRTLDDLSRRLSALSPGTSLLIPVFVTILAFTPGLNWPKAFPEMAVPVQLIEKHSDLLAAGRVFASDQIANYLIFQNYPRQKVFFDSRHNYYGEKIGNDFIAINVAGSKWKRLVDRYDFNLILCEQESALATIVTATPGWHIVDHTPKFVLFERKDGKS